MISNESEDLEDSSRGQVDVFEMTIVDETYKYLFVYEDRVTRFVVLKAMRTDSVEETARKLLDILTIIGIPKILQSGNGRKFTEQVVDKLHSMWNGFSLLHKDILKFEGGERDFKKLIELWLKRNPTRSWYEGIKTVQIMENTSFKHVNGKVPYDVLFSINATKDFLDIMQSKIIYSKPEKESLTEICTKQTLCDINSYNKQELESNFKSKKSSMKKLDSHDFNFVNIKSETFLNNFNIEDSFSDEEPVSDDTKHVKKTDKYFLKCNICQKQYMKLGHLRNHIKSHTEENFTCTICSKVFQVQNLYKKHMQQVHRKKTKYLIINDKLHLENKTSKKESKKFELEKYISRTRISANEECNDRIGKNHLKSNVEQNNSTKYFFISKEKSFRKKQIKKPSNNPLLKCSYCKQKFDFPSVLKRHMRSHTNERPYVCQVCNKSFKQLGHLSQHTLTHTDYRSFQCIICGIKFESLENLKRHSYTHQGETAFNIKDTYKLFECDSCKKVFTTKSVLERHIFTHTHERQFDCKICGKRFKQAGHVKSHMLVHTGERKFECTICTKRFSLSNSLKKHMYIHNGDKPYQCDVCGARFLEKRNLNGHLMTHTNERPHFCKICGKRYTLADTLRRHISATHEDGRTYQCEICAKMFKQLAHLSVHKKVHNDERPFQCHLCEKNFKHKNVLKSHLAIHANVRPFECDICKANFVRKTNLQTHISSAHMNERPYTCTICGKKFKQISHLNGHVIVHSNSLPYQCDFCDRRCNRLDNLKKHMKLHTKNKESQGE